MRVLRAAIARGFVNRPYLAFAAKPPMGDWTSAVASSTRPDYVLFSEARAVRVDKFRMNQGPADLRAGPFFVPSSRTCGNTHREGFDHEHVVSVRCSITLRTQHNIIPVQE